MFSTTATIADIATSPGRGALAGRTQPLEPRLATFARIVTAEGTADEVLLTFFCSISLLGQERAIVTACPGKTRLRWSFNLN